jgi:hypothetical protein
MIDLDIYYPNKTVEDFLQNIKIQLNRDCPTVKVYISTANPYQHWIINNTNLMEDCYAKNGTNWS